MNISSNPWSFLQTDVLTTTITAISLNADGTVNAVVTASAGFLQGNQVTVADNTTAVYNGFYTVLAVPDGTHLTLIPSPPSKIPVGQGAGGANGSVSLCQYSSWVRAEDIKWDKVAASATLDIRDRNGNIVWQATQPSTANVPPNYNRGKVFWINGLTLISVGTAPSILLVTVN